MTLAVQEVFPLAVIQQITQSKTNPCMITLQSGNRTQVDLHIWVDMLTILVRS